MTADIVAMIDGALEDFATSEDAMRWAPPVAPWDEPIVRDPCNLIERHMRDGLDGYAATALCAATVGNAFQDIGRILGQAMKNLISGFTQLAEVFERAGLITPKPPTPPLRRPPTQTDGRPKWQSPYGPKQYRRHA